MVYREIERLKERPSLLGYGCMRLPTVPDSNGTVDEEKAYALIHRALEAGVNYFDTAYLYHNGQSEAVLGRVLQGVDRRTYRLATKLPVGMVKTQEDALRILEEQLDRLQTDYIDFYLLHGIGRERWENTKELGLIPLFEQLQREGKIRHFGFSFHDSYEVFEEILTYRQWDFCQIQLNYMDVDFQAGLKGCRLAEKLGVPVFVMEPVKGGSLANLPEHIADLFRSANPSVTPASWAMRWAVSAPAVKVVLSGMTEMAQLEDNLKTFAAVEPLTAEDYAVVDRVAGAIRGLVKNGCTGCGYCMPCPFGVDIPRNFSVWNEYAMYHNVRNTRHMYRTVLGESRADRCKKCGACESKCPQSIAIRADLERLHQELQAVE